MGLANQGGYAGSPTIDIVYRLGLLEDRKVTYINISQHQSGYTWKMSYTKGQNSTRVPFYVNF